VPLPGSSSRPDQQQAQRQRRRWVALAPLVAKAAGISFPHRARRAIEQPEGSAPSVPADGDNALASETIVTVISIEKCWYCFYVQVTIWKSLYALHGHAACGQSNAVLEHLDDACVSVNLEEVHAAISGVCTQVEGSCGCHQNQMLRDCAVSASFSCSHRSRSEYIGFGFSSSSVVSSRNMLLEAFKLRFPRFRLLSTAHFIHRRKLRYASLVVFVSFCVEPGARFKAVTCACCQVHLCIQHTSSSFERRPAARQGSLHRSLHAQDGSRGLPTMPCSVSMPRAVSCNDGLLLGERALRMLFMLQV